MDSKQHQQLCDLAQGLRTDSLPSQELILAVMAAYLESPTLFNGGLAVLAFRKFFAAEDPVPARRALTRILGDGADLIVVVGIGEKEKAARLARMRHLMNVVRESLTQRKELAPQFYGILALCEADQVMRTPPDKWREAWEEYAYKRHILQAGGSETDEGSHSSYSWPRGGDAFELAAPLALRRGTLRELAFGVVKSDRPKSSRAALIRRFWQISRTSWNTR